MINLLSEMVWGSEKFGFGYEYGRPAVYIFTLPIYVYALCIVTGMCVAILVSALYFKKRGYDPYDVTIYALVLIPLGVLGARAYVYIFPWGTEAGVYTPDWSDYFDFRSGGLGIYGGVIMGYVSAFVLSKIKKQDFRIVTDSILPGVMIAQSIGRWGNFANQEAHGRLITDVYDNLAHAGSGLFSKFNGYAVWIDASHAGSTGAGWYEATFFYESVCTFLGFLVCVLILTRVKHYKLGWCTAFYGIYYGIVRLIIEGFRTDSLYFYVGTKLTDIKISQLVSIWTIVLGVWLLSKIYRKELHGLYKKLFKNDLDEMKKSRWILLALSVVLLGIGVTMFVLGGESKFIIGFFATVLAVYSALGVWSLFDRIKLYCKDCGECHAPVETWQTDRTKHLVAVICYGTVIGLLAVFGLFSLIKWGIVDKVPNGIVLMVVCFAVAIAIVLWKLLPAYKAFVQSPADQTKGVTTVNCECGKTYEVKLNKFLLFLFPPKVYINYGVEHLKPWVDPNSKKGKQKAETPAE